MFLTSGNAAPVITVTNLGNVPWETFAVTASLGRPAFFLVPAALAQVPKVASWSPSLGALSATLAVAPRHPACLSSYELRCQGNQLRKGRGLAAFPSLGESAMLPARRKAGWVSIRPPNQGLSRSNNTSAPPGCGGTCWLRAPPQQLCTKLQLGGN